MLLRCSPEPQDPAVFPECTKTRPAVPSDCDSLLSSKASHTCLSLASISPFPCPPPLPTVAFHSSLHHTLPYTIARWAQLPKASPCCHLPAQKPLASVHSVPVESQCLYVVFQVLQALGPAFLCICSPSTAPYTSLPQPGQTHNSCTHLRCLVELTYGQFPDFIDNVNVLPGVVQFVWGPSPCDQRAFSCTVCSFRSVLFSQLYLLKSYYPSNATSSMKPLSVPFA